MTELIIFTFGILTGVLGTYFTIRAQASSTHQLQGIATHTEKQQNEKQSRKERILTMIREKGSVTNNDIEKALDVSDASVTNYLQELEREGKIEQIGERGRFVSYRLKK